MSKNNFLLHPIRFCINNGEPFSNKPMTHIKIIIGDKKINPKKENEKSSKRIIYFVSFFLFPLSH
jgi:hypothetical protein